MLLGVPRRGFWREYLAIILLFLGFGDVIAAPLPWIASQPQAHSSEASPSANPTFTGNATTQPSQKVRVFFNDTVDLDSRHFLSLSSIDVYDEEGDFITPLAWGASMSSVLVAPSSEGGGFHGPATLLPAYFNPAGDASWELDYPCTSFMHNPWMELDFNPNITISFIRVVGRDEGDDLIGVIVAVIDRQGHTKWHSRIQEDRKNHSFIVVGLPVAAGLKASVKSSVERFDNTFFASVYDKAVHGIEGVQASSANKEQRSRHESTSSGGNTSYLNLIAIAASATVAIGGVAAGVYVSRGKMRKLLTGSRFNYKSTSNHDFDVDGEGDSEEEEDEEEVGEEEEEEEGDVSNKHQLLGRQWEHVRINPFASSPAQPSSTTPPSSARGKVQTYINKH